MTGLFLGGLLACVLLGEDPPAPVPGAAPGEKPVPEPIPAAFRSALKPGEPFPLEPGWRWTYTCRGKLALFFETREELPPAKTGTTWFIITDNHNFWGRDLHLFLEDGKLVSKGEESTEVYLPSELEPEASWASIYGPEDPWNVRAKFTGRIRQEEIVEVPAGRFTAIRIDYTHDFHVGLKDDLQTWFAKGIGFVKIVDWQSSIGGLGKPGKLPLQYPIVYELLCVERAADAHPIHFPCRPVPADYLPSQVSSEDGKVTLFADFRDRWRGGIVIYLVNRTAKELEFRPFNALSREVKGADGLWYPASDESPPLGQTPLTIPPGTFTRLLGPEAKQGEEHELRYGLEELRLVSNLGRGRVNHRFALLARYRPSLGREPDIEVIRTILFGKLEPDEKAILEGLAIQALANLERDVALPVLERLIQSPQYLQSHFDEIAALFARLDQSRLAAWGARILTEGPPNLRHRIIESCLLHGSQDEEVRKALFGLVQDPKAADLPLLLAHVGSLRVPEARELLARIATSDDYTEDVGIAADYWECEYFGTKVLDVDFKFIFRSEGSTFPPVPLEVTLKNSSGKHIDFRYQNPSEIVRLYVKWGSSVEGIGVPFQASKARVAWFRSSDHGVTRVSLAPGESHTFRMQVLDYFELPTDQDRSGEPLWLRLSCSLPGLHEVPQMGGPSKSIRVERSK
jgi:hypothetical protein